MKLGKKGEGGYMYSGGAEALCGRGSYDGDNEALTRVLALDPHNQQAVLLRGMIAADSGDSPAAVKYLGQVHDLDSRPDGLRALLRAKIQSGNVDATQCVPPKLLSLHNYLTLFTTFTEWYFA